MSMTPTSLTEKQFEEHIRPIFGCASLLLIADRLREIREFQGKKVDFLSYLISSEAQLAFNPPKIQ